jgi:hypothetical protein
MKKYNPRYYHSTTLLKKKAKNQKNSCKKVTKNNTLCYTIYTICVVPRIMIGANDILTEGGLKFCLPYYIMTPFLNDEERVNLKKLTTICLLLLCICLLAGCSCRHSWENATCDTPQTCRFCQETTGEPLAHNWVDATCQEPKHGSQHKFFSGGIKNDRQKKQNPFAAVYVDPDPCAGRMRL